MTTKEIEDGKIVRCKDCEYWNRSGIEEHRHSGEFPERTAQFAECMKWSCWSTCMMSREDDYCSQATEINCNRPLA